MLGWSTFPPSRKRLRITRPTKLSAGGALSQLTGHQGACTHCADCGHSRRQMFLLDLPTRYRVNRLYDELAAMIRFPVVGKPWIVSTKVAQVMRHGARSKLIEQLVTLTTMTTKVCP